MPARCAINKENFAAHMRDSCEWIEDIEHGNSMVLVVVLIRDSNYSIERNYTIRVFCQS